MTSASAGLPERYAAVACAITTRGSFSIHGDAEARRARIGAAVLRSPRRIAFQASGTQRGPGLAETLRGDQRALGDALLPLGPLAGGLAVTAVGFQRLDGRECRVVREGVLVAAVGGLVELFRGLGEIAELVLDRAGEEARGGPLLAIHATTQHLIQGLLGLLERREAIGARQQSVLLIAIPHLRERQRRRRRFGRRAWSATGMRRRRGRDERRDREHGQGLEAAGPADHFGFS